jgi:hypothetical protein
LADRIHDAAKQFAAVNPNHEVPNVLVLTNSDQQCGFLDLLGVLTGNLYVEGGGVEPIYKSISEGRIREEKLTIDLYVWLNEWKGEAQKGSMYFISGRHYESLCKLLGSDPARHRRL